MSVEQEALLDYAICDDGNSTTYSHYNLSVTPHVELYVHAAVLTAIILFGLCGNAIILLLVACDKRLRHRSTYASLNIVLVDFLLTIFYHGVALTSILQRQWPYGNDDVEVCRFYSFMSPYFIYVRWIALSLICVDRFLTVRFPFHYERHNKCFLLILTGLVWLIPVLFGGIIIQVGRPTFRANVPTCVVSCVNEDNAGGTTICRFLNVFLFTCTFIIGGLIPSILYTWMYCRGRHLRRKIVMGKFAESATRVTAGVVITDPRSITHQDSDEVSRERRTLTTLIVMYLAVVLTSLPQYVILLLRGLSICAFFKIPISVHFVVADIFFLSTALDPFVLLRTRDFRRAFFQYIICKRMDVHPTVVHSSSMIRSTSSINNVSVQSTSL